MRLPMQLEENEGSGLVGWRSRLWFWKRIGTRFGL